MSSFAKIAEDMRARREGTRDRRPEASPVGVAVFVICLIVAAPLTARFQNPGFIIAGVIIGLYFLFAIKVAKQWEKADCCAWAGTKDSAAQACS